MITWKNVSTQLSSASSEHPGDEAASRRLTASATRGSKEALISRALFFQHTSSLKLQPDAPLCPVGEILPWSRPPRRSSQIPSLSPAQWLHWSTCVHYSSQQPRSDGHSHLCVLHRPHHHLEEARSRVRAVFFVSLPAWRAKRTTLLDMQVSTPQVARITRTSGGLERRTGAWWTASTESHATNHPGD